jgi:hypothetical protein
MDWDEGLPSVNQSASEVKKFRPRRSFVKQARIRRVNWHVIQEQSVVFAVAKA